MTPAERVALREARAKIDEALGEPSVSDPDLVAYLNQLIRTPSNDSIAIANLAFEIGKAWANRDR